MATSTRCHHSTNLFVEEGRGRSSRSFLGRIMAPFLLANFLATVHCILYRTYTGGEAPPISKIQNAM